MAKGSVRSLGKPDELKRGSDTPDELKRGSDTPDELKRGFSTPKSTPKSNPKSTPKRKQKDVVFCPIEKHANAILRSGKQMASGMRRLRHNLSRCRRCPAFGMCEFRENFNQLIDAVILEINAEWGLP